MLMSLYNIKVLDVLDKEDGSALVDLEITDETKQYIKNSYGWKRWSNKKFEKLFIEALIRYTDKAKSSND